MSQKTKRKWMCPKHDVDLKPCTTKWGIRWSCPMTGCSVRRWDGSTSTPCDQATATLRKAAHEQFDLLWKRKSVVTQSDHRRVRRMHCYAYLARELQIPRSECHFGMFDASQCLAALNVIEKLGEE